ncbi:winged helix-turn-helix domain-containing protein [Pseudomonas putida]
MATLMHWIYALGVLHLNLTSATYLGFAPTGNQRLVTADSVSPNTEIVFEDIRLRIARREVVCGGAVVMLKKTPFLLLALLACHPQEVVTRKKIFKEIWGYDFDTQTKRIEVQVHYLRRMLLTVGSSVRIKTYYGTGLSLKVNAAHGE